jgi:uncharacterized protein (TIGR02301 family)
MKSALHSHIANHIANLASRLLRLAHQKGHAFRLMSKARGQQLFWAAALSLCIFVQHPIQSFAADKALPPYEQKLRRLSSIIGALMYLDPLCNKSDATQWHNNMAAILKAENPDDVRNRQLTARFNQSYKTYAGTYTECNIQARRIVGLYRQEAQELLVLLQLKHAR